MRYYDGPRRSSLGNYPKMRLPLFLDIATAGIPVALACRGLGFSKQAFSA